MVARVFAGLKQREAVAGRFVSILLEVRQLTAISNPQKREAETLVFASRYFTMKHISIFLSTACLLLSCYSKKHSENKSVLPAVSEARVSLNKVARFDVSLPEDLVVDAETQVYYSDADSLLFFFDPFKNRFISYTLSDGNLKKAIPITGHFPDEFKVTGVWFHNLDTILLYDYSHKQLCLADCSGKIFKSLTLPIPKNRNAPAPWYPSPVVDNNSPAVVYNGEIFFTGYVSGEGDVENFEGRCINAILSIEDSSIKFMTHYTEVYRGNNYGGFYFRTPYAAYNRARNALFISLPASHDVIEIDLQSKFQKLINLSPPFQIDIPAIDEPKMALARKANLAAEHYSTNFSYKNIIYHPYKNVYLRILEHPVQKHRLNHNKLGIKRRTILIYDENFRFLGQRQLDTLLSTQNYFITPNGVCFFNNGNRNENVAQYVYYQFL